MSYASGTAGANCASGASWSTKTFTPISPSSLTGTPKLCDNIKSYVPASGAWSNTNFFQIFAKSKNLLPALVVGNYLGSFPAMFSRRNIHEAPAGWVQTFSLTSEAYITGGWVGPLTYLSTNAAQTYTQSPPVTQLRSPFALPEIDAQYGSAMASDWITCVKTQPPSATATSGAACY
jgi:hypothetical protein